MTNYATFSTRELLAELAHLDVAIRDAPTVLDPTDSGSALSPQFLGLLSQQLGRPVALDPESAGGRALLERAATSMIRNLDADGLKIDFTAAGPAGSWLVHAGALWGIDLLHELLAVLYRAVKRINRMRSSSPTRPTPTSATSATCCALTTSSWPTGPLGPLSHPTARRATPSSRR